VLPHPISPERAQDIRQVWFAGVHSDIGGGYPEAESHLAKYPLIWMIEQARGAGLEIVEQSFNQFARGEPREGSSYTSVKPDCAQRLHRSLTGAWWLLEALPKRQAWREWPRWPALLGHYIPWGEPRRVPDGSRIHRSVFDRKASVPGYEPANLPANATTEP